MVVDNLERDGYVRRIRSKEDRRYYQIQITEEGQKNQYCAAINSR